MEGSTLVKVEQQEEINPKFLQGILAEWKQKPDENLLKAGGMRGYRGKKLKTQEKEMLEEVPKRPQTSEKHPLKGRQMQEPWTSERETPGQL